MLIITSHANSYEALITAEYEKGVQLSENFPLHRNLTNALLSTNPIQGVHCAELMISFELNKLSIRAAQWTDYKWGELR